ncbi:MAG: XdhC family protein [Pseudomonadota bacterium]
MQSDDILALAEEWHAAGRKVALATVVSTWGSSPRPAGSSLLIDREGNMMGSVSGGCVEGAVVREAQEVIDTGEVKLIDYGVSNEQAWEVGLACGGSLQIYIEPLA